MIVDSANLINLCIECITLDFRVEVEEQTSYSQEYLLMEH